MRVTAATARRILRRQGMPPQEIRAVLAAADPLVVHRLMELHRERLEEWLEEQERLVATIERSLVREGAPREAKMLCGQGFGSHERVRSLERERSADRYPSNAIDM